ncbi:2Fe-2S iron-sulfur cluster-binding protein [Pseudovibrio sp. JE062]|uniref:PDR/VanB family oxidoreductase n=1 Tax=Pseudovibrio sp. JE062 TaxID=439495 RepID=UPI000186BC5C|nr:2Fe-2S iron-sulfur cluster-binding protein [Pseudovibrio sp. JE062]EEA96653.1 vanillate O-demethylase oxidoreductase [Pseudovibrio sp. JE062]
MKTLIIEGVRTVAPKIKRFDLKAEDNGPLIQFEAGAHIAVQLKDGSSRQYSLIDFGENLPYENQRYTLGILLEQDGSGGSAFMHSLQVGNAIQAEAPKNDFPLIEDDRPAVLIAGGIGVTPIISMAAALKRAGKPYALHYSGRTLETMAFKEELSELCGEALTLHHDVDPARCLDLSALIPTLDTSSHIYVCGPKGMIEAVREQALSAGFSKEQIHFELFASPAPSGDDAGGGFEVEVKSSGEVFWVPKDKSIVDVLEDGGVDLVYDCQRGDCGICQVDVLEGEPDHRDVVLTDDEKAAGDVMHICVSRAKSKRLVLDL